MNVIVLSAGKSSRLIKKNKKTPKTFRIVNGKPILAWQLLKIEKYNYKKIFINILKKNQKYIQELNNFTNIKFKISYEHNPLGSVGGVRQIIKRFKLKGLILLIYGDNLSDCNYQRMIEFHKSKKSDFTIAYYRKKNPFYSGIIEIYQNKIISFKEKQTKKNNKIYNLNSGIYLFDVKFFKHYDCKNFDFAKDFIPEILSKKKRVMGYKIKNLYTFDKEYLFKIKRKSPFGFDSL